MNMCLDQIINEIRRLNAGVEIRVGDMNMDSLAWDRIFSSVPGNELVLPEGFYYHDTHGITNRHCSPTGDYISLKVESIDNVYVPTYPNVDIRKMGKITNAKEFAIALQKLNPHNGIMLSKNAADERIFCDHPELLALPIGFFHHKGCITDMRDLDVKVEKISSMKPEELTDTGYDRQQAIQDQFEEDKKRTAEHEKEKNNTEDPDEEEVKGKTEVPDEEKENINKQKKSKKTKWLVGVLWACAFLHNPLLTVVVYAGYKYAKKQVANDNWHPSTIFGRLTKFFKQEEKRTKDEGKSRTKK